MQMSVEMLSLLSLHRPRPHTPAFNKPLSLQFARQCAKRQRKSCTDNREECQMDGGEMYEGERESDIRGHFLQLDWRDFSWRTFRKALILFPLRASHQLPVVFLKKWSAKILHRSNNRITADVNKNCTWSVAGVSYSGCRKIWFFRCSFRLGFFLFFFHAWR